MQNTQIKVNSKEMKVVEGLSGLDWNTSCLLALQIINIANKFFKTNLNKSTLDKFKQEAVEEMFEKSPEIRVVETESGVVLVSISGLPVIEIRYKESDLLITKAYNVLDLDYFVSKVNKAFSKLFRKALPGKIVSEKELSSLLKFGKAINRIKIDNKLYLWLNDHVWVGENHSVVTLVQISDNDYEFSGFYSSDTLGMYLKEKIRNNENFVQKEELCLVIDYQNETINSARIGYVGNLPVTINGRLLDFTRYAFFLED